MKNTVSVQQLFNFEREAMGWLNYTEDRKTFPYFDTPLGECIKKVMPEVKRALAKLDKANKNFNIDMDSIKAKHAKSIRLNESKSDIVGREYVFEPGSEMEKVLREQEAHREEYIPKEAELMKEEVEIETEYCYHRPTRNMLPLHLEKIMIGIVIDPTSTTDVKILRP